MKYNFKAGDDVWYFTFPEDGCGRFDVDDIRLKVDKNINAYKLTQSYIAYCFPSQEEAIKSILEKIKTIEKNKYMD